MENKFKIVLSSTGYKPSLSSEIEKDSDGYYKVRLGAFNVFNSGGEFYISEGVSDLINNPNSFFYRRLKKGYLTGEMDHPVMTPGMTLPQFMNRNAKVNSDRIAFHVRDVMLTETDDEVASMGNYGKVLLVEGWIKPSGPMGKYLQEALDNPNRNIAFSVRSISKDRKINGIKIKHTTAILTWDWVSEPGINNVNTFDMLNQKNINTESASVMLSLDLDKEDVNNMVECLEECGINTESSDADYIREISSTIADSFSNSTVSRILNW